MYHIDPTNPLTVWSQKEEADPITLQEKQSAATGRSACLGNRAFS